MEELCNLENGPWVHITTTAHNKEDFASAVSTLRLKDVFDNHLWYGLPEGTENYGFCNLCKEHRGDKAAKVQNCWGDHCASDWHRKAYNHCFYDGKDWRPHLRPDLVFQMWPLKNGTVLVFNHFTFQLRVVDPAMPIFMPMI